MTTEAQAALVARILPLIAERAEAAWLSGSLGAGAGDAFSDVDFVALAADGAAGELAAHLQRRIADAIDPVILNALFGGRVLNVVTEDWERFDIVVMERGELVRLDGDAVRLLFNKGDSAPAPASEHLYVTSPEALRALVTEFLRVLGLAPVAIGRAEHQVALTGADLLRRMTIDLFLETNGISPARRGGALKRNPLLTAAQRAALDGLPPLSADRASLIAFHAAVAQVFLPAARALAASVGMPWPERLFEATRRHLSTALAIPI